MFIHIKDYRFNVDDISTYIQDGSKLSIVTKSGAPYRVDFDSKKHLEEFLHYLDGLTSAEHVTFIEPSLSDPHSAGNPSLVVDRKNMRIGTKNTLVL